MHYTNLSIFTAFAAFAAVACGRVVDTPDTLPVPTSTVDPTTLPMLRYEIDFSQVPGLNGYKNGGLTVGNLNNFGVTLLAIPEQKLGEAFSKDVPPVATNTFDYGGCSSDGRLLEQKVFRLKPGVPMYLDAVETELDYTDEVAPGDIGACYGIRVAGTWQWFLRTPQIAEYSKTLKRWVARISIRTKNVDAIKLAYARGMAEMPSPKLVYFGRPM
jgi:hypothetical protein